MLFRAEPCGCEEEIGMSRSREPHFCRHDNRLVYTKGLGTKGADGSHSPTNLNRAISEASPAQRAKVKDALSIVSAQGPCDPAHVTPRSAGGCDHPDCVVPLTRREHRDYDDGKLDILGVLIAGGFWVELGHAVVAHQTPPTILVERLTGEPYGPTNHLHRRIADLESAVAA